VPSSQVHEIHLQIVKKEGVNELLIRIKKNSLLVNSSINRAASYHKVALEGSPCACTQSRGLYMLFQQKLVFLGNPYVDVVFQNSNQLVAQCSDGGAS
jgi:hypothetical protein